MNINQVHGVKIYVKCNMGGSKRAFGISLRKFPGVWLQHRFVGFELSMFRFVLGIFVVIICVVNVVVCCFAQINGSKDLL